MDRNNVAPRVGLTYDLSGDGTAVVRGGYGRFYDKTHFELISDPDGRRLLNFFEVKLPHQQRGSRTVAGHGARRIRCWLAVRR